MPRVARRIGLEVCLAVAVRDDIRFLERDDGRRWVATALVMGECRVAVA